MVTKLTLVIVAFCVVLPSCTRALQPGENKVELRGRDQTVYYIPAAGQVHRGTVLFTPGDGGWRGVAVDWAQQMASWGYDVYGIDTKTYLENTTGDSGLQPSDVSRDYTELRAKLSTKDDVDLVGWSEGAALSLLASTDLTGKQPPFRGLVAIGLPETGILGWRWKDAVTWLTRRTPDEPRFSAKDYIQKVKVPIIFLHSSGDRSIAESTERGLFASSPAPKQFMLISARGHDFGSNRNDFYIALQKALEWTATTH